MNVLTDCFLKEVKKSVRLVFVILIFTLYHFETTAGELKKARVSKERKSDNFYDSLQTKASKSKFTRELYDLMFTSSNKNNSNNTDLQQRRFPYKKYNGKTIRKITIKRIDVFGPEVYNLKEEPRNFLEKSANKVHINTSERIIRNYLIMEEGQIFNDFKRADNERILRNLPSINDARIIVSNVNYKNNTVDILVIVKDVWSLGFNIEVSDKKISQVDLWQKNFMGFGHETTNSLLWNENYPSTTGYKGMYNIKNIFGSFIDLRANYYSAFDLHGYSFDFSREFFTPTTHYAGSIMYEKIQRNQYIPYKEIADTFHINYEHMNFWMARAFNISSNKNSGYRSSVVLSFGYNKINYYESPPVDFDLLYNYQTRELYIGGLSFSSQNFVKTNYFYSFGRTEDIPTGLLASAFVGYEINQFKYRIYTQLSMLAGYHHTKAGYIYNSFDLSFFTNTEGNMEQGAAQFRFNYYSNLLKLGKFRFRQFIKTNYITGFGRYKDDALSINDRYGIRGFSTDSLNYQKKLVFNTESVLFTPFFFYGFQFVFFTFLDVGFTGPIQKSVIQNRLYSGIGFGFRVRNDHLVFKTIQFRFGYYPGAPADMQKTMMSLSSEYRLNPESFYVKKPEVFNFR